MSGVKLDIAIWNYDRAAALRRPIDVRHRLSVPARAERRCERLLPRWRPRWTVRMKIASGNWERLRAEIRR
jgi:hypothetical protein